MEHCEHVIDIVESVIVHLVQVAHLANELLEFGFIDVDLGKPSHQDLIREDPCHFRIVV